MNKLKEKVFKRDAFDTEYFLNEVDSIYNFVDEILLTKEDIKKSLKKNNVVLISMEKDEGLYYCKENSSFYYVTTDEENFFDDEDVSEFYKITLKEMDKFIDNYMSGASKESERIKKIEDWLDDIA